MGQVQAGNCGAFTSRFFALHLQMQNSKNLKQLNNNYATKTEYPDSSSPPDIGERFCDLRLLFWRGDEKLMSRHGSEAEV